MGEQKKITTQNKKSWRERLQKWWEKFVKPLFGEKLSKEEINDAKRDWEKTQVSLKKSKVISVLEVITLVVSVLSVTSYFMLDAYFKSNGISREIWDLIGAEDLTIPLGTTILEIYNVLLVAIGSILVHFIMFPIKEKFATFEVSCFLGGKLSILGFLFVFSIGVNILSFLPDVFLEGKYILFRIASTVGLTSFFLLFAHFVGENLPQRKYRKMLGQVSLFIVLVMIVFCHISQGRFFSKEFYVFYASVGVGLFVVTFWNHYKIKPAARMVAVIAVFFVVKGLAGIFSGLLTPQTFDFSFQYEGSWVERETNQVMIYHTSKYLILKDTTTKEVKMYDNKNIGQIKFLTEK